MLHNFGEMDQIAAERETLPESAKGDAVYSDLCLTI
jgi:hypothetical protein